MSLGGKTTLDENHSSRQQSWKNWPISMDDAKFYIILDLSVLFLWYRADNIIILVLDKSEKLN